MKRLRSPLNNRGGYQKDKKHMRMLLVHLRGGSNHAADLVLDLKDKGFCFAEEREEENHVGLEECLEHAMPWLLFRNIHQCLIDRACTLDISCQGTGKEAAQTRTNVLVVFMRKSKRARKSAECMLYLSGFWNSA
jgi:hypothetical protein